MTEEEKAEWLDERSAIIHEGAGLSAMTIAEADALALQCWQRNFEEQQPSLF